MHIAATAAALKAAIRLSSASGRLNALKSVQQTAYLCLIPFANSHCCNIHKNNKNNNNSSKSNNATASTKTSNELHHLLAHSFLLLGLLLGYFAAIAGTHMRFGTIKMDFIAIQTTLTHSNRPYICVCVYICVYCRVCQKSRLCFALLALKCSPSMST